MKIDKVILSCNSNPLYLDFWPIVSKIWTNKFGIHPILLYVNDSDEQLNIDEKYGSIINIKPISNIPVSLQCLWIRYWYPIQEPNSVFIISDIDMIPLSKSYFIDNIASFSSESYLHINPCIKSYGLIPSCYHIAKGYMFQKILDLSDSFEEDIDKVYNFDRTNIQTGWFNDEKYATKKILDKIENKNQNIFLIPRTEGQNGRRIDRSNWHYFPHLVKQGYYYDCHSIRPYSKFSNQIDTLCDLIE